MLWSEAVWIWIPLGLLVLGVQGWRVGSQRGSTRGGRAAGVTALVLGFLDAIPGLFLLQHVGGAVLLEGDPVAIAKRFAPAVLFVSARLLTAALVVLAGARALRRPPGWALLRIAAATDIALDLAVLLLAAGRAGSSGFLRLLLAKGIYLVFLFTWPRRSEPAAAGRGGGKG